MKSDVRGFALSGNVISAFVLVCCVGFFAQSCSTQRVPERYNYIGALERLKEREAKDRATSASPSSSEGAVEVFVLGSFHFAENNLQQYPQQDLDSIRALILRYRPTTVFIEDVSPEKSYKEEHYNYLTKGTFTQRLDSFAARSGISRAAAPELAARLREELRQSPQSGLTRAKLGAALYISLDDVNAVYQWCACLLDKQPDFPAREQEAERYFPRNATDYCKRVQNNEIYAIGAALASNLGLEKLQYMDDQSERERNDSLLNIVYGGMVGHFLLRPWLYPAMLDLAFNNPGVVIQRAVERGEGLTECNDVNLWIRGALAYHEFTRLDAGAEWFDVWGRRNEAMIANVVRQIEERRAQSSRETIRALIIVGVSHAGPFVAELERQAPAYRVRTLSSLQSSGKNP